MQEEKSDDLLFEVKGGNFQHQGCEYLAWMELTVAANCYFHSLIAQDRDSWKSQEHWWVRGRGCLLFWWIILPVNTLVFIYCIWLLLLSSCNRDLLASKAYTLFTNWSFIEKVCQQLGQVLANSKPLTHWLDWSTGSLNASPSRTNFKRPGRLAVPLYKPFTMTSGWEPQDSLSMCSLVLY